MITVKGILYLILFVLVLASIPAYILWVQINTGKFHDIEQSEIFQFIYDTCSNKSTMRDKAECVSDELYPYFEYRINFGYATADSLFTRGGDCKHWTVFHRAMGEKMGYKTKASIVTRHVFAIWHSDEGYCILDQLMARCVVWM